jgi:hypothetical protein
MQAAYPPRALRERFGSVKASDRHHPSGAVRCDPWIGADDRERLAND